MFDFSFFSNDEFPEPARVEAGKSIALAIVTLVVAVFIGIWLTIDYAKGERDRELLRIQSQQGIIADSRSASVGRWVNELLATMHGLTRNLSLQLYMTQVSLARDVDVDQPPPTAAEEAYLKNLIIVTADRAGFMPQRLDPVVNANIELVGQSGLALVDIEGRLIVATPGMNTGTERLRQAIQQAQKGAPYLIDLHIGSSGDLMIGFASAVYAIQRDTGKSHPVGYVLGLRTVGRNLFDLLVQPGETSSTGESYLVRKTGSPIEYLTPLADGTLPLSKIMDMDTHKLAAAFTINKPGAFGAKLNYVGENVLTTSRTIPGTSWTLVRNIGRSEAMGPTESRLRNNSLILIFIIIGIALVMVLAWRHGTSIRYARQAGAYQMATQYLSALNTIMNTVMNSHPTSICLIDQDGRLGYVNSRFAENAGMTREEIAGKTLPSVLGAGRAELFVRHNQNALDSKETISETFSVEVGGRVHTLKSDHIPLSGDTLPDGSLLMIVEDLTVLVGAHERYERMLRDVVQTLVAVVEQRDPYSSNHSTKVAEVAKVIAEELGAHSDALRTVEFAANLMNLGKLYVPKRILKKDSELTPEEQEKVYNCTLKGAELLRNVRFELPVVDTLRQIHEHIDGSGYPDGLKGNEILHAARIISVANSFVALISPRPYREAMTLDQACAVLMEQVGTILDISPVSALVSFIENKGGAEKWKSLGEAS